MAIEFQIPEADPIEAAVIEWVGSADLYRDGELVREGVNLLGSNEVAAKVWARVLASRLREPIDRDGLAAFLLTRAAAQHVRAYSSAPIIAEGILVMLKTKGLLP
ncbi:hypothetical protein [Nocardia tengchongensis]|uniref:hypothetical protein n=1 Tax=Nocardia tengchongensis TaxID=2055889 RepID=UPI00365923C1